MAICVLSSSQCLSRFGHVLVFVCTAEALQYIAQNSIESATSIHICIYRVLLFEHRHAKFAFAKTFSDISDNFAKIKAEKVPHDFFLGFIKIFDYAF